ncbi:MAG: hypothetical protein RPU13_06820 [Candidatus Sedimenticola sp. (ex Thyasira tokunagai)]
MSPLSAIAVTVISPQVFSRRNNILIFLAAVLFSPLLLLHAAEGGGSVNLSLGRISVADWVAEGVRVELFLGDKRDRFNLSATDFTHPSLPFPIKSLQYECHKGRLTDRQVDCQQGRLKLQHPALKQPYIPLSFSWRKERRQIDITIDKTAIFGGDAAAKLSYKGGHWQADFDGKGLGLSAVGEEIAAIEKLRSEYGGSGAVDLDIRLSGNQNGLLKGRWKGRFDDFGFSYQDDNYIGEDLSGIWDGAFVNRGGRWEGKQSLVLKKGAVLTPVFYIAPDGKPVSLASDFVYSAKEEMLKLPHFIFNHLNTSGFHGNGTFSLGSENEVVELEVISDEVEVATLFSAYLEPVLADPVFSDLELAGQMTGTLNIKRGRGVEAGIRLKEIFVEQGAAGDAQFALYGVNGEVNWRDRGEVRASTLSWRGGHLFGGIDLGASVFDLEVQGQQLKLNKPATVPVLDGSLHVERFGFEQSREGPQVHFQGYLTPVSMEKFSHAVGWPVLAGQLSGMIPGISYSSGMIAVEGMALIKVFGGSVLIRNLVLDDLFGTLPAFSADIGLKNLDLETLTGTFSFGKITGRIEGEVKQLRLEDWQPVSFDAWLATPVEDDSRHRISQKAVDSISNLGGSGVSGALSRSFMRFFDEFGYDRLGVSCTLENGVCEMSGVEPADQGYYLVKGGGIPRIDIMGFNHRTDWNILVSKLQQIAAGGAPVVE